MGASNKRAATATRTRVAYRPAARGAHPRAQASPNVCAHIDVRHAPKVPKGVTLPALSDR